MLSCCRAVVNLRARRQPVHADDGQAGDQHRHGSTRGSRDRCVGHGGGQRKVGSAVSCGEGLPTPCARRHGRSRSFPRGPRCAPPGRTRRPSIDGRVLRDAAISGLLAGLPRAPERLDSIHRHTLMSRWLPNEKPAMNFYSTTAVLSGLRPRSVAVGRGGGDAYQTHCSDWAAEAVIGCLHGRGDDGDRRLGSGLGLGRSAAGGGPCCRRRRPRGLSRALKVRGPMRRAAVAVTCTT